MVDETTTTPEAQAAAKEIIAAASKWTRRCDDAKRIPELLYDIAQGIIAKHYAAQTAEVERLTRERDGLAELLKSEQATAGYAGAAAMRLNCCPKDVPDMVTGLQQQLAAVTAERDENIMSCEATYDEWKRMQKRAEAAEAESGLLTRSLERAMNWKDAAEARVAELENPHDP